MASDNINQVGKAIKKIRDDTDYALKKYHTTPRIEKSRDVFDTIEPFVMEFKVDDGETALLDLMFNKPPPQGACGSGCITGKCEGFDFSDGGDHLLQLTGTPVLTNSVKVLRNAELLDSSHWDLRDPNNGYLFVQGSGGLDHFTVCYLYGDCQCTDQNCSNVRVINGNTGAGEMYLVAGNCEGGESLSNPNDQSTMFLYAGCTYAVQYLCYHNPAEWAIRVGITYGNAVVEMGGPGYLANWDNPIYGNQVYGQSSFTAPISKDYGVVIEHVTRAGFCATASSVTARLFYVSGPDPRFQNLNLCDIPAFDQGWGTLIGNGDCQHVTP